MIALVARENRGGVRTGGGGGRPVVDVTSVSSCRLGFGCWRQKLLLTRVVVFTIARSH